MKTLILNASPRRDGLISQMLDIMKDELTAKGNEVEYIEVCKLYVRPCIGCMKCRSSLKCVMPEDEAQRVLRLMKECDSLIVGSPCYWGNINGQLKVLFDRMVYGMMGENSFGVPIPLHKGKKAIVVSTSTTLWPLNILFHQTSGVVRALKEILGWSGFKIVTTVQKGGTHKHHELTERDIKKCKRAVRKL